jgi:hypothetical protein
MPIPPSRMQLLVSRWAVTDDVAKWAKTPPASFIPSTCSWVVQGINAQAIATFGQPLSRHHHIKYQ